MKAACSKPHKHASSKACAEHMHRWLLQSASWHLAKLCSAHFQQHPSHNKMLDLACDIRNELTNAVQTTFTKAGVVHTKVSCVRDMYTKRVQSSCTKTVEQSRFLSLSIFRLPRAENPTASDPNAGGLLGNAKDRNL